MTRTGPIRVLVVDDSAFMRTAITRMITSDPMLSVVGTARDGVEGLEKIAQLNPDVVTMDVEMPRMSGLDALSRVMAERPRPVIMISSITQEGAQATIEALSRGAFDYIPKQLSYVSLDIVKIKADLIAKIKAAMRLPGAAFGGHPPAPVLTPVAAPPPRHAPAGSRFPLPHIVCIGTSTGGPKALQALLPLLPAEFPVPILIVQHMPVGFTGPFARRLDSFCKIHVVEAADEQRLEPGTAYIGPAGFHIRPVAAMPSGFKVQLSKTPYDLPHIPSVDVMMLAAAEAYGSHAMGVILTGMGADGLKGMTAIYQGGGLTVGEDEKTCTVYGMPRACAEARVLHRVVPLDLVTSEMISATRYNPLRAAASAGS